MKLHSVTTGAPPKKGNLPHVVFAGSSSPKVPINHAWRGQRGKRVITAPSPFEGVTVSLNRVKTLEKFWESDTPVLTPTNLASGTCKLRQSKNLSQAPSSHWVTPWLLGVSVPLFAMSVARPRAVPCLDTILTVSVMSHQGHLVTRPQLWAACVCTGLRAAWGTWGWVLEQSQWILLSLSQGGAHGGDHFNKEHLKQ